jgi:hypothetical protein
MKVPHFSMDGGSFLSAFLFSDPVDMLKIMNETTMTERLILIAIAIPVIMIPIRAAILQTKENVLRTIPTPSAFLRDNHRRYPPSP